MRLLNSQVHLSASDLSNHLGCRHLTSRPRAATSSPSASKRACRSPAAKAAQMRRSDERDSSIALGVGEEVYGESTISFASNMRRP